jgi:stage II sporulation protein D
MSNPLSDNDLVDRRHRERSRGAAVLFFMISVCTLIVIGCKPRQVERDTPQMSAENVYWIRVRLLSRVSRCAIETPGRFTVVSDPNLPIPNGGGEKLVLSLSRNRLYLGEHPIDARELDIEFGKPDIFSVDGVRYRGKAKVVVRDDAQSFDLINWVPLEPYLAGVIGAEMPGFWESEALKTQAVVARTYCLFIKGRFGKNRLWDLSKTQAHQVYRGVQAESPTVWEAVKATHGQVLTIPTDDDPEAIFPTYYSSICGGHTENSKYVFGDSYACLQGVHCFYCQDVAKINQFYWPVATYSKRAVSDRLIKRYPSLKKLGTIQEIVPMVQSEQPGIARFTRVTLVGANGKTDTLRGEDLRLCIDSSGRTIRSTVCTLADWGSQWAFESGQGWGHGVGLCQCGAQALARRGRTQQEILSYYYPGARIKHLYE